MIGFLRKKVYPIGIDLGSHSLKMIQVTGAEGKLDLLAAAKAIVPEQIQEKPLELHNWYITNIKEQLLMMPFKGRRAVISLPTRDMLIQHLRMPQMPEDQLEKTLPWEAQERLPFPTAGALLRHITVGEVYEGDETLLEVILMAASRNAIQQHLHLMEQAKIEISSIQVEACALVNGFTHLPPENDNAQQSMMLIDLGHTCVKVVVAHGQKVAFCRTINMNAESNSEDAAPGESTLSSSESISEAPSSTNEMPMATTILSHTACKEAPSESVSQTVLQNLGSEIRSCLRYHDLLFTTQPVEKVIFVGGQAKNKVLCQQLAQDLGLPAQLGDPLARITKESRIGKHSELDDEEINSDWAVAFGLSLGEMGANTKLPWKK